MGRVSGEEGASHVHCRKHHLQVIGCVIVFYFSFFVFFLSRYASLYFCCAVENQDNELLTLEIVHRYVELLDKYFGNVCELDIIFNFEKAYFILDEFIMGGEIQETSKKSAVKAIEDSDMLQETMEEYMNKPTF
ncbi:AP-1 complex subunit sigma-3 [Leptonychotes weddellii]|uniref:AP-1 complex subunit sigma-3 n=1 Tax=Leptonychotes weddellii TaxID=9713 RepID=A0A7F8Q405_LEPWE|nr:AP-1 complex subunit sigma-3 [Leptonychotes weddellii]